MAQQGTNPRQNESQRSAEPSWFAVGARQTRLLFLVVAVAVFLLFLWQAVAVLLLVFAAALIALALRFLGDNLSEFTRIPPLWSLTIVLLFILVATGVGFAFAAPALSEQLYDFWGRLETTVRQLDQYLRQIGAGKWLLDQWSRNEDENMANLLPRLVGFFGLTLGAVGIFLVTLVVSVFLAYNPNLYVSGFLRLVPKSKRDRTSQVLSELGHTLRWWMVGQLISMLLLTVTTWAMLWVMGVPLPLLLGLITGLLTFVPYLGPTIAAVPIVFIAFVQSPLLAVWVLGLYLVIQNIETALLMPIVYEKTVRLPPALTVVSQLLLGAMFGIPGVLLATPLMAAGMVVVKMVYVEDVIRDDFNQPVKEMPE